MRQPLKANQRDILMLATEKHVSQNSTSFPRTELLSEGTTLHCLTSHADVLLCASMIKVLTDRIDRSVNSASVP